MYVLQYQSGKYRMSGGGVVPSKDDRNVARYATYADAFNARAMDARMSGQFARVVEL